MTKINNLAGLLRVTRDCYKLLALRELRRLGAISVAVLSNGEMHRVVILLGILLRYPYARDAAARGSC